MFVNLHTHQPLLSPDTLEIESVWLGQAKEPLSPHLSVGLHPWHLTGFDSKSAEKWLREQAARPEVIAIGEAGLDKVTSTSWDLQVLAFQWCIQISEAYQKPLVIHCVRAFSEILALKKQQKPTQPWIFHGFEKNLKTAAMLLNAGCWLSFGSALFRENSHAAEALRQTPGDFLFLETDMSDFSIQEVYERAAAIRGVGLEDLKKQTWSNYKALF
ncbi:MAG: TatD family hydrolase [Saprospiraceae bacterium]